MNTLKNLLLTMAIGLSSAACTAQTEVCLTPPSTQGGLSVMEALWNRHSDREFASRPISEQDLSDLLFAASGINRPSDGKITSPTALNTQEIDLYVINSEGAYKYVPAGHKLQLVKEGDYRSLVAGTPQFKQDFVMQAPLSMVIVANPGKFERGGDRSRDFAIADAGIMCENICLACAGKGLATVPRASMDSEALSNLLSLPEQSFPVLNLPVGYPKE